MSVPCPQYTHAAHIPHCIQDDATFAILSAFSPELSIRFALIQEVSTMPEIVLSALLISIGLPHSVGWTEKFTVMVFVSLLFA